MKLLEINFTSDELSDYKRGESVRLFEVSPHIANSMKRLSIEDAIIWHWNRELLIVYGLNEGANVLNKMLEKKKSYK